MNLLSRLSLTPLTAALLFGQATVESAIGTAAGAGAAAGAAGVGNAAGGVLGGLSRTLDKAGKAQPGSSSQPAAQSGALPLPSAARRENAPKPIDPAKVAAGMTRAELDELGWPSSTVQQSRGGQFVETLWYPANGEGELRVELIDNKVVSARLSSGEYIVAAPARPGYRGPTAKQ
jgi:hypothetical protein